MSQPLRRSQRQRVVSRRKSDIPYTEAVEPNPKECIQFKNSIFQKATQPKIELTDRERELLEERQEAEAINCVCGYSEAEVKGTIMIACDVCDNWFHDECVGLTADEAAAAETYVCPRCSHKPKAVRKRAKPSTSELEILIGALEVLDDVDKPRTKKKVWEPKSQTPKVAAYHLPAPTNSGRCIGIVGYLRNESHPSPSLDNGYLTPITLADMDQGFITTSWGFYRVTWQNGQIAASRDYAFKSQSKDSFQGSDSNSIEDSGILLGRLETAISEDYVEFTFEGLPMLKFPLYKVPSALNSTHEHLEKVMNAELRPEVVQKLMKDKLKIKVSILGL